VPDNEQRKRQLIEDALSSLAPGDIQALAQRLALGGLQSVEEILAATAPPSRRRPRRSDVVTLRVRVDLAGTRPPVWRRLELASDLFLDELHEILQAAFGWTDYHLHRFGCGPQYYSRETEYYLCPLSVDEGDVGVPEEQVRLDEVLVDVDDKLFYNYDFGDDWEHVIRLEAVLAREDTAPRAVCTAGRRPGPAEDCGGVGGYELLTAATDPTHPDHAEACVEYATMYGPEADPTGWAPTPFDLDKVNGVLAGFAAMPSPHELTGPLREVFDVIRTTLGQRDFRQLIGSARLQQPILIDADAAAVAVRPYTWLLNRIGDDGITLTQAGYLPPAQVAAAVTELDLDEVWIGKGNRENLTYPVLHLRLSAQRIGLLRKDRGRLRTTAKGRALRGDPVGLWWHLAQRLPVRSNDACAYQASLLYLAAVAAGIADGHDHIVADLLDAIGWMRGDGTPITAGSAAQAAFDIKDTLRRMGLLHNGRGLDREDHLTKNAVTFARAALTTWQ
jgi:Plasmid pRiA4b ORF-3-like protein